MACNLTLLVSIVKYDKASLRIVNFFFLNTDDGQWSSTRFSAATPCVLDWFE